ncbi:MAG: GntR family transcriptional regulator [Mycetocola sp.]
MTTRAIGKIEQAESLRGRIGESLSAAIISGELSPGSLVSVPTLAAQFEVSATPVREAMLDLAQRGFVEPVRNKGFRVTTVSLEELRDIIEVRQLLEAPAMRSLVGELSADDLAFWREQATTIAGHAERGELTSFIESDRNFHLGLIGLHGNSRLVAMVSELRSQTRMVNLAAMRESPELAQSAREHHEMLDLLESGNGAELEELTVRHLSHVVAWWGAPKSSD